MIYDNVQNLIFDTKFSSINRAKGEKRLVFWLPFVNLQRAEDGSHVLDVNNWYVFAVWISSNRTVGITPH